MSHPRRIFAFFVVPCMAMWLTCGGGGSGGTKQAPSPTPADSFSVGNSSISLWVDSSSGTVGTVTVPLTRSNGFAGSVDLSVSEVPTGVKAQFAQSSITGTSDELTIQAGYPDPSDATFKKQILPSKGTYTLTVTGKSGSQTATGYVTLTIGDPTGDFAVAFIKDSTYLDSFTNITLHNGQTAVNDHQSSGATAQFPIAVYVSQSGSFASDSATLGVQGKPAGLNVQFDSTTVKLNELTHWVTFTASSDSSVFPAGTYFFNITAVDGNQTRYLPVVITNSPNPFWVQPTATPSLIPGGSAVTFPVYLGHNDTFYQSSGSGSTLTTTYLDGTYLSIQSLPIGISATLGDLDPTQAASVPLTVSASNSAALGTNTIVVRVTRNGAFTDMNIPVNVTTQPMAWIQNVEWGQTVLEPNLRLVPGKPALLRVHVLGNTSDQSTSLSATIKDASDTIIDTLDLSGPTLIPTTTVEGDLATTYCASLPAEDIVHGMKVVIANGASINQTITPNVQDAGFVLNLTAVPIYHNGIQGIIPADADLKARMLSYWPIQNISIRHRSVYTTSTVVPLPNSDSSLDHTGDGWVQLLNEITALRLIDGSSDSYYGFFDPFGTTWSGGRSTVGLHQLGVGAGIGIDVVTQQKYSGLDPVEVMVHELGHGFNLNHAPGGGAGDPQLDFPYEGSSIGSWGCDMTGSSPVLYDPSQYHDIMSYLGGYWVSDWDYLKAQAWIDTMANGSGGWHALPFQENAVASKQHIITGWQGPDGQIHLSPVVRAICKPVSPSPGALELRVSGTSGTRSVSFGAKQLPDLPSGYRVFAFTVPGEEELASVEIRKGGSILNRQSVTKNLKVRGQSLDKATASGELITEERDGFLHLRWNASEHPYVSVIHEGTKRTTLALHLSGGSAELPLAGLPVGGQFLIHYSDGLNAVVRSVSRSANP